MIMNPEGRLSVLYPQAAALRRPFARPGRLFSGDSALTNPAKCDNLYLGAADKGSPRMAQIVVPAQGIPRDYFAFCIQSGVTMQSVIALGFFDGVHLGHGDLLSQTATLAAEKGCRSLALTFDRSPGKDGRLLTTVADRVRLMRTLYGIQDVVVLPFTEAFMRQPWDAFLDSLVRDYKAAHLVCGWDYRFGFRGAGNSELLREWCEAHGLGCDVVKPRIIDGVTVSATHLKTLVEAGDVETAARFYGHPHSLSGVVQQGKHLGHTLGFPTANLLPAPELVLPRDGVYAVRGSVAVAHTVRRCTEPGMGGQAMLVLTDDEHRGRFSVFDNTENRPLCWVGVCNVGTNPTVDGQVRTVETWLSGFEGDLYGQTLTVDFYRLLRPERRFPSLDELRAQVFRDREAALACFAEGTRETCY